MEEEEEDVSSYWMTLEKNKVLGIERGSTRSHHVVEEVMDLS